MDSYVSRDGVIVVEIHCGPGFTLLGVLVNPGLVVCRTNIKLYDLMV